MDNPKSDSATKQAEACSAFFSEKSGDPLPGEAVAVIGDWIEEQKRSYGNPLSGIATLFGLCGAVGGGIGWSMSSSVDGTGFGGIIGMILLPLPLMALPALFGSIGRRREKYQAKRSDLPAPHCYDGAVADDPQWQVNSEGKCVNENYCPRCLKTLPGGQIGDRIRGVWFETFCHSRDGRVGCGFKSRHLEWVRPVAR